MSRLRKASIVLAAATMVAGSGVCAYGLFGDPAGKSLTQVSDLSTPVISVRRAPLMLSESIGAAAVNASLKTALADPTMTGVDKQSCVYAEIPSSAGVRQLITINPDSQVTPASTLKVVTARTALATMDPALGFSTVLRSAGSIAGGTLSGDLWLVGGGDPLLETTAYTATKRHAAGVATSLDALADQVVARGIAHIAGSVVGDSRLFDDQLVVPSWKNSYVTTGEVGPVSGLIVNDNFTKLDSKNRPIAATDVGVDDATAFAKLLTERGVVMDGPPIAAQRGTPGAQVVAPQEIGRVTSIPLSGVIAEMLSESDNTTAETVLKHIGLATSGKGSTQAGIDAIAKTLKTLGVPDVDIAGLHMVDGSGLDRSDKVTCNLLVSVIRSTPEDGPLVGGFALMGKSGTLRERLRNSIASGRVKAKTGTLNGVSALTGVATDTLNESVRFAMVLNGLSSTAYGVTVGDKLAEGLASFPQAPSRGLLGPIGISITLGSDPNGPRPTTTTETTTTTVKPSTTLTGDITLPALDTSAQSDSVAVPSETSFNPPSS